MKNYMYSFIVLLVSSIVYGTPPNWTAPLPNNYQYSMSFIGFASLNGNQLTNTDDIVAAFVGNECRGLVKLIQNPSTGNYYAYLTVRSNTPNETIHFKIYDSTNDVVSDVNKTERFVDNTEISGSSTYGDLFNPYAFSNQTLATEAKITGITFTGIPIYETLIDGHKITYFVGKNQARNALPTNFTLSTGASIFKGVTPILSGSNLDFTNPVVFTVRSQDQAKANNKEWTIEVKNLTQNAAYYKKDFVCYESGSIKILYPVENTEAVLKKNGSIKERKNITNGELIFNNLDPGTYEVTIDGNVKEIIINLKQ